MKVQSRFLIPIIEVAFLGAAFLIAGCSAHATYGYRVHDAGYNDYHVYDHNEEVYYNQWTVETHHDRRDFRKLNKNEQRDYWKWRHDHH